MATGKGVTRIWLPLGLVWTGERGLSALCAWYGVPHMAHREPEHVETLLKGAAYSMLDEFCDLGVEFDLSGLFLLPVLDRYMPVVLRTPHECVVVGPGLDVLPIEAVRLMPDAVN